MSNTRIARHGFTLVELLVVIAIIGILIALLLPAVQAAREAARRGQCLNNLKQVCLAMLNYENANKVFPINWSTSPNSTPKNDAVGHSWLTAVLPFIEEDVLYNSIKQGGKLSDNLLPANVDEPPRQPVPEFVCPSDLHYGTMKNQALLTGIVGVTNFKAVAGMNWPYSVNMDGTPNDSQPVVSARGRNAGKSDGREYGNGIICRGKINACTPPAPLHVTAVRDIRDGTTKTFAIGESVPQWCQTSAWYDYNSATATCGVPLNYKNPNDKTEADRALDDNYNNSFMSRHRGGANFAFCDGSVNFVADDIEYLAVGSTPAKLIPGVYMNLATIDGGEMARLPNP